MSSSSEDGKSRISAREMNSRPLPKRFYSEVSVGAVEPAGGAIRLDGKNARTPKKSELRLPTLSLARAIAGEWAAQGDRVDPARMPLTRLANTAIDGVKAHEVEVRADIVKYAGSDLVCYRAERPDGLVRQQAELWGSVLRWAEERLDARFNTAIGTMHVAQPPESLRCIERAVAPLGAFELTALHTMTTLTGSALIALGVHGKAWSVEEAWRAAHVDEDWQIALWGEDAEAQARREKRWIEMSAAARLLDLLSVASD